MMDCNNFLINTLAYFTFRDFIWPDVRREIFLMNAIYLKFNLKAIFSSFEMLDANHANFGKSGSYNFKLKK